MHVVPVKTRKDQQEFLDIPRTIYADDSSWICPLDREKTIVFFNIVLPPCIIPVKDPLVTLAGDLYQEL